MQFVVSRGHNGIWRIIVEPHSDNSILGNQVSIAVSLSREGMFAKACGILVSSGLAPNKDDTWQSMMTHGSC